MTVQAQNSVQYYTGPIEIGTELSIVEFTFIDNSHVSAKVRGNTEVWRYGYDYTISGAQTLIRTITVQRRVAENEVLAVYLDVPITQNISPEEGGNFPASTNEYVLDKLTYISQMLDERLKRSLQISIDTPFSGTLPAPEPNKALKISSDGNSFVMSDYDPDLALTTTEDFKNQAQQAATNALSSQTAAASSEIIASQAAETAFQAAEVAKESAERLSGAGLPIGSVFQAIRTDVPANSLRADGTEYSSGFENFVSNFLATGTILCKSFDEWQTEYTMTNGNVGFFAYNAETGAFKVPCVQAGTFLAQAFASGEFGSFLNSELKSHNHIQTEHNHDFSGWTEVAGGHVHAGNLSGGADDGGPYFTTSVSADGPLINTTYAGEHNHTFYGVTGIAHPTILPTGGNDTYPKHIRYPFFVVVTNTQSEQATQADWDNFVGNLDGKANKSFTNLDPQAEKHFLNKTQITNCILDNPKKINVVIENGYLVLKAGSKVIVPNGVGVFDEITISQDISFKPDGGVEGNLPVFYEPATNSLIYRYHSEMYSGDTAPTTSLIMIWYDTANNYIKTTRDGGVTWSTQNASFPICFITANIDHTVTSIVQTFDNIGYIGGIVWRGKDLNYLIPQGRNADGTLNNLDFTSSNVAIAACGVTANGPAWVTASSDYGVLMDFDILSYRQPTEPVHRSEYVVWFDTTNNQWKQYLNGAWQNQTRCDIGYITISNGRITSLKVQRPFRAINYEDREEIVRMGIPSDRFDILAIGASGTTYTAPAHGYFHFFCCPNITGYSQAWLGIPRTGFVDWDGQDGAPRMLSASIFVEKGEIVELCYELPGGLRADSRLWFYYAKGVK